MNSRLKQDPDHLFIVFVVLSREKGTQEIKLTGSYPSELEHVPDLPSLLKQVSSFAFPCSIESSMVDHFTFTLTGLDAKYQFGFCRHNPGSDTALCIVSELPWYSIFYKILNRLAEYFLDEDTSTENLEKFLYRIYSNPVPQPGDKVSISLTDIPTSGRFSREAAYSVLEFTAPDPTALATITEDRNLLEYYNAVDIHDMLGLFASMLHERRILISSHKLSRLSACVHGCALLLYPMHWQHLYIPVLPEAVIDYVSAPMPFLIGVHESMMGRVRMMELGDVVILDADAGKGALSSPYNDLASLPSNVVSNMKRQLKDVAKEGPDTLSRIFLKALVQMIGGYREGLVASSPQAGTPSLITFDGEAFISSRPASMRPFLENMLQLQVFQQFIDERLELINEQKTFSDEFENECAMYSGRGAVPGQPKMYQVMKSIQKEGKERMSELSHKAQPALKKAKAKGSKAFKDVRSFVSSQFKKEDKIIERSPEQLANQQKLNSLGRSRPQTLTGSELHSARPPRPSLEDRLEMKRQSNSLTPVRRRESYEIARQYNVLSFTEEDDIMKKGDGWMDLMEDEEIKAVMHRSFSAECILADEDKAIEASSDTSSNLSLVVPPRQPYADTTSNDSYTGPGGSGADSGAYSAHGSPLAPPRRRKKKSHGLTESAEQLADATDGPSKAVDPFGATSFADSLADEIKEMGINQLKQGLVAKPGGGTATAGSSATLHGKFTRPIFPPPPRPGVADDTGKGRALDSGPRREKSTNAVRLMSEKFSDSINARLRHQETGIRLEAEKEQLARTNSVGSSSSSSDSRVAALKADKITQLQTALTAKVNPIGKAAVSLGVVVSPPDGSSSSSRLLHVPVGRVRSASNKLVQGSGGAGSQLIDLGGSEPSQESNSAMSSQVPHPQNLHMGHGSGDARDCMVYQSPSVCSSSKTIDSQSAASQRASPTALVTTGSLTTGETPTLAVGLHEDLVGLDLTAPVTTETVVQRPAPATKPVSLSYNSPSLRVSTPLSPATPVSVMTPYSTFGGFGSNTSAYAPAGWNPILAAARRQPGFPNRGPVAAPSGIAMGVTSPLTVPAMKANGVFQSIAPQQTTMSGNKGIPMSGGDAFSVAGNKNSAIQPDLLGGPVDGSASGGSLLQPLVAQGAAGGSKTKSSDPFADLVKFG